MRVRLKKDRVKQYSGMIRHQAAGSVLEVPDAEANKLIERGIAERIDLEADDGVEYATQERGQKARRKQETKV